MLSPYFLYKEGGERIVIKQTIKSMFWAVLFCTFLNVGRTLEAAQSKEGLKVKMGGILRQIPEAYQLGDRLNEGNFRDAFQLLDADLTKRVQEYQDAALAYSLSHGDKGKEAVLGNVSGTEDRIIMPGALNLPRLFLLNALREKKLVDLLWLDNYLDQFYAGMSNSATSDIFKNVFKYEESRFYMKSSFWNIDFKTDFNLLGSKLEEKFGTSNLMIDLSIGGGSTGYKQQLHNQYWDGNHWGNGVKKSQQNYFLYSQPDGFAQRHIVSETKIQPVTHQGQGDQATNNCGLHALINAELLLNGSENKAFLVNHDERINRMRQEISNVYKEFRQSKKQTEVLTENLNSDDLSNAIKKEVENYTIFISIPEQIKLIAEKNLDSVAEYWRSDFDKKMRAFCQGGVGEKIVFLFNTVEYTLEEELFKRLKNVIEETQDQVQKDLFNIFNQKDKVGHWITVMFEKTAKIETRDQVDRYLIRTTLADSLGTRAADATFLQLFFLQQLKKYEDE